jgi:hypothetical protein
MAAREVGFDELPLSRRQQLVQLLGEPPILGEPVPRNVGIAWWVLAACGALLVGALLLWQVGVVTSVYHSNVYGILVPYFGGAVAFAYGVLRGMRALARRKLPWQPGRFLYPWGFVDGTAATLRVRSIASFGGYEIELDQAASIAHLVFVKVKVKFGDEVEVFRLATLTQHLEKNVPKEVLETLAARRDEVKAVRASGDVERIVREEPLSSEALAPAKTREAGQPSAPRAPALARRAGTSSLVFGALVAAALHLQVLPRLSLAQAGHSPYALRGVRHAFHFGWVDDRVSARLLEEVEAAGKKLREGRSDGRPLATAMLYDCATRGEPTVYVRVLTPPSEQQKKVSDWLASQARGGQKAAPIVMYHAVVSLAAHTAGEDQIIQALSSAAQSQVRHDLLTFEREPESGAGNAALVIVEISVAPGPVLSGEGNRVFAGLTLGYSARLQIHGDAGTPILREPFTVPPPAHLSVSRYTFGDEKPKPLGANGDALLDMMDDSMVYTKQMDEAAAKAGEAIAARIF